MIESRLYKMKLSSLVLYCGVHGMFCGGYNLCKPVSPPHRYHVKAFLKLFAMGFMSVKIYEWVGVGRMKIYSVDIGVCERRGEIWGAEGCMSLTGFYLLLPSDIAWNDLCRQAFSFLLCFIGTSEVEIPLYDSSWRGESISPQGVCISTGGQRAKASL